MQNQPTIRPAQQSDKEAVFKFCEHTFNWGDYITNVWDRWLEEEQARLFAATLNNKPVGIMRVSLQKPGEAWLQAARTDPDYRHKGIATALTTACLKWAKPKEPKQQCLRQTLTTKWPKKHSKNLASPKISGFLIRKCNEFEIEKAKNCKWAQRSDAEKIWKFLTNSDMFTKSADLYTILFT